MINRDKAKVTIKKADKNKKRPVLPLSRLDLFNANYAKDSRSIEPINDNDEYKPDEIINIYQKSNSCINHQGLISNPNQNQYLLFNNNRKKYFPKANQLNQSTSITQGSMLFPSVSLNTINQSTKPNNSIVSFKSNSKQYVKSKPMSKFIINKNKIRLPLFNKHMIRRINDIEAFSNKENDTNYYKSIMTSNKSIVNFATMKKHMNEGKHKKKLYFPEHLYSFNANFNKNRREICNTYTEISELDVKLKNEFSFLRDKFNSMTLFKRLGVEGT